MSFANPRRGVVLVVEDDWTARELYRAALHHRAGFVVVAVDDGVDALRFLELNEPDAVVLDLGLPRLDGRDVLKDMAARGLTSRIPVTVVTGQSAESLDSQDYFALLPKPVDPDHLVAVVEKSIRLAKA